MTNIYPFADRPDVPIKVLFYPVPLSTTNLPYPNPFVLRNFDRREMLDPPTIGTKYDDKLYYPGPTPVVPPHPPCGTADQWASGVSYETYLAGGYHCDCPEVTLATYVVDVYSPLGTLLVSPHDTHVLVDIDTTHVNVWTGQQTFDARPNPSNDALQAWGNNGVGDILALEVHGNGNVFLGGQVALGVNGYQPQQNLRITVASGWTGVTLIGAGGHGTGTLLHMQTAGPTYGWGMDAAGHWKTDQTTPTPLNTVGSVIAKYPLYDQTGTLIGWLPVYDTIT